MQFFGIDTFVDHPYEQAFSPEFKAVLACYIQGVNAYAAAHPDQRGAHRSVTLVVTVWSAEMVSAASEKEGGPSLIRTSRLKPSGSVG